MTTLMMVLLALAFVAGCMGDGFSAGDEHDADGEWERSEMNKEGMNYKG